MNSDKSKQDKKQIEQNEKNDLPKNNPTSAQTDGFRYDYDDSSDVR